MKINRIFPYHKTAGERRHEEQVKQTKINGFKHPGSKSCRILYTIVKTNLIEQTYHRALKFLK